MQENEEIFSVTSYKDDDTLNEKAENGNKQNSGKNQKKPNASTVICIVVMAIIVSFASGIIGYYVRDAEKTKVVYKDRYSYLKAEGFEKYDLLTKAMVLADNDFYEDVDYDAMDKALAVAFIDALDDYSNMSATGSGSSSKNEGIGISMHITEYNEYYVDYVYEGSAADGKLKRGDKLLAVTNDSNPLLINFRIDCLDYAYLPSCFAGPIGTKLILHINRGGVEMDVLIEKAEYTIQRAYYIDNLGGDIPDDMGYIKLSSFTDTAAADFEKCINAFTADGNNALILDLRGNSGGSTSIMGEIGSYLVSDGNGTKEVPIIKFGNDANITYRTKDSSKYINKPIYVLTNSQTASASEALLSAMLYYNTATATIGMQTYGKGIGQGSAILTDDDTVAYNVSITTGRYYTFVEESEEYPDGLKCIHGVGITPQYTFKQYETNAFLTDRSNDLLIKKAALLYGGGAE